MLIIFHMGSGGLRTSVRSQSCWHPQTDRHDHFNALIFFRAAFSSKKPAKMGPKNHEKNNQGNPNPNLTIELFTLFSTKALVWYMCVLKHFIRRIRSMLKNGKISIYMYFDWTIYFIQYKGSRLIYVCVETFYKGSRLIYVCVETFYKTYKKCKSTKKY